MIHIGTDVKAAGKESRIHTLTISDELIADSPKQVLQKFDEYVLRVRSTVVDLIGGDK